MKPSSLLAVLTATALVITTTVLLALRATTTNTSSSSVSHSHTLVDITFLANALSSQPQRRRLHLVVPFHRRLKKTDEEKDNKKRNKEDEKRAKEEEKKKEKDNKKKNKDRDEVEDDRDVRQQSRDKDEEWDCRCRFTLTVWGAEAAQCVLCETPEEGSGSYYDGEEVTDFGSMFDMGQRNGPEPVEDIITRRGPDEGNSRPGVEAEEDTITRNRPNEEGNSRPGAEIEEDIITRNRPNEEGNSRPGVEAEEDIITRNGPDEEDEEESANGIRPVNGIQPIGGIRSVDSFVVHEAPPQQPNGRGGDVEFVDEIVVRHHPTEDESNAEEIGIERETDILESTVYDARPRGEMRAVPICRRNGGRVECSFNFYGNRRRHRYLRGSLV